MARSSHTATTNGSGRPPCSGNYEAPAAHDCGVGVHARALAWFIADAWDGPIEDVDWDKARAQRFVETVCALAGASPLPDLLAA